MSGDVRCSDNVLALAEKICELSLVEVVQLNEFLKEKLKISDADLSGPVAVAAATVSAAPPVDTKTEFTITVTKAPESKVQLIKFVKESRESEGVAVSLIDAKNMVESLPFVLCEKVNKEKLDKYTAKLKEMGAEFTVD